MAIRARGRVGRARVRGYLPDRQRDLAAAEPARRAPPRRIERHPVLHARHACSVRLRGMVRVRVGVRVSLRVTWPTDWPGTPGVGRAEIVRRYSL